MKLTYHGQSTFVVEEGEHRIIIDPFLNGNPKAVIKAKDVKVEAVLLTHGHGDHVADAEEIARANDATIIACNELAGYYARKGLKTHPLHIGGGRDFAFGRVKLTLAFHGSGIDTDDGMLYVGPPTGILLTMSGKTLYHAGDTGLFGDMKLIGELNKIDVAALPIGDNFTMGPDDALHAAEWVKARYVIPMHYNTFPLIAQDGEGYVKSLKERNIEGVYLAPGQSFEV
jgi:L-ascorbate metabolism protein UlaG (beta-lactamase superfamily)